MKFERDTDRLHAFVDGELDLSASLEVEQRIAQDPAARHEVDALRRLRGVMRDRSDYHVAPSALRDRIATLAGSAASDATPAHPARPWRGWRPLSAALAFALVASIGIRLLRSGDDDLRLRDDVVASHVRSTIGGRLVDIASSDHHTVKPWLSSKLDYSPPVRDSDLAGAEFLGGRVDYLDGRPVAALVYRMKGHVVDAFVWPTKDGDRAVGYSSDRGFQVAHWSRAGMTWWAISDVSCAEFGDLVGALAVE